MDNDRYPSCTKVLLLEGAPLHKLHLNIIPFSEFDDSCHTQCNNPIQGPLDGGPKIFNLPILYPPSGAVRRRLTNSLWA